MLSMRTVVLCCGVIANWATSGLAQIKPVPAPAHIPLPIATVDILQIYKSYKPVVEKLQTIRASVQELERTLQIRQVEFEGVQRKLQSPTSAQEEKEKLQLQLVKLQTELKIFVDRERLGLQKREIAIQVETYKLIQAETHRIAKERGLRLVLIRPQRSLDSENLAEVVQTLNQAILFEEDLDITNDVLKALEAHLKPMEPKLN